MTSAGSPPSSAANRPVDFAAASRTYVAGLAALEARDFVAAEKHLRRSLEINPDNFAAVLKFASLLIDLGRYDEALGYSETATRLNPRHAPAWSGLAWAKLNLNLTEAALADFDRALALQANLADAYAGRGIGLSRLANFADAAIAFDKGAALSGELAYLRGEAVHSRMLACDWTGLAEAEAHLVAALREGIRTVQPFPLLPIADDPALQLACGAMDVAARAGAPAPPLWRGEPYTHDRIRVAYFSPDFREHAVSLLTAGVFEHHDRRRFHPIAVSIGNEDGGAMRARLMAGFETFVDARNTPDQRVAQWLHDAGVDVLVDLCGASGGGRPKIFAARPAPVQVSYLGFPGTSGAAFFDYIIADGFLVPPGADAHYSEKVVRLPDCFQANDDKRPRPASTPPRSALGLPDDGFVFCTFNNTHKINPALFDIWMRLLQAVPGSVLWVTAADARTRAHLADEAERRGVDPGRLVVAGRLPYAEHLARMRAADLFLDAYPFNAGATASDALWAGVPVVTRAGASFAARMAGSLLHGIRLPELVTYSAADYEALALRLATHPAELADLRARLAANRDTAPLFDTARFTRHLEAAYETMAGRARAGLPAEAFAVAPLPRS